MPKMTWQFDLTRFYIQNLCLNILYDFQGIRVACTTLKERLDVVKEKMKKESGKEPEWLELVKQSYAQDVDLSERYWWA